MIPTPEHADPQASQVQLTLTGSEAERLRTTLPWLVHALADRPTVQPRQRERRGVARTALEHLLAQLQHAADERDRPSGDLSCLS